jgi:hypothetical protein
MRPKAINDHLNLAKAILQEKNQSSATSEEIDIDVPGKN